MNFIHYIAHWGGEGGSDVATSGLLPRVHAQITRAETEHLRTLICIIIINNYMECVCSSVFCMCCMGLI